MVANVVKSSTKQNNGQMFYSHSSQPTSSDNTPSSGTVDISSQASVMNQLSMSHGPSIVPSPSYITRSTFVQTLSMPDRTYLGLTSEQISSCVGVSHSFDLSLPSLPVARDTQTTASPSQSPSIPTPIGKPPTVRSILPNQSPRGSCRSKHTCKECGKVFKRAHNLKIHGRLHNGDKPYSCPFSNCDKEFRWKSSIVSHINWHRTKRGDVLPIDAAIIQTATSKRPLAPFLKPLVSNSGTTESDKQEYDGSPRDSCIGLMPQSLNYMTASTSSSDVTENEMGGAFAKTKHDLRQKDSKFSGPVEYPSFIQATSTDIEVPVEKGTLIASEKAAQLASDALPGSVTNEISQEEYEYFKDNASSPEGGGVVDVVNRLVRKNLNPEAQENIFIDEYVDENILQRLEIPFTSSVTTKEASEEREDGERYEDVFGCTELERSEDASKDMSSEDFGLFPSTTSATLAQGSLGYFGQEGWDEEGDAGEAESLIAGLLLRTGSEQKNDGDLLTGCFDRGC